MTEKSRRIEGYSQYRYSLRGTYADNKYRGNAEKQKKTLSLSTKVFRMFMAGTIVLGLILQIIVLGLYSFAVANQYIATSYNLHDCVGIMTVPSSPTISVSASITT